MKLDRSRVLLLLIVAILVAVLRCHLDRPQAPADDAANDRTATHVERSGDSASKTAPAPEASSTDERRAFVATNTTPTAEVAPPGASLLVRVRSTDGEPVVAAPVIVNLADEDTTADLFMSKTVRRTDSRGEVRFVDLRPGSHLVSSWVNSFE
ncbi:MAG: hypothetical protein AB7I19_12415, partial [Planctomycetota bacterium]